MTLHLFMLLFSSETTILLNLTFCHFLFVRGGGFEVMTLGAWVDYFTSVLPPLAILTKLFDKYLQFKYLFGRLIKVFTLWRKLRYTRDFQNWKIFFFSFLKRTSLAQFSPLCKQAPNGSHDTQNNDISITINEPQHSVWRQCCYTECCLCWVLFTCSVSQMLSVIMPNVIVLNVIVLNVIVLNVIMLNVIMLNVIMLTVIMLNVIMLTVIMLSVTAFNKQPSYVNF